MRYFDAHFDTITRTADAGLDMFKNDMHISFDKLKKFDQYAGVFAIWQDDTISGEKAYEGFWRYYDYFTKQVEKYGDMVSFCKTKNDYEKALADKKIAAFLSIEGGLALNGDVNNLDKFHEAGVRLMTLTWNNRIDLCDGVATQENLGFSQFGRDVIKRMSKLRMIIDVSHLSERGFWELMEMEHGVVVASHSNSQMFCEYMRNLTNEQITALKAAGGGVGINLYDKFISNYPNPGIRHLIKHIDNILSLGGEDMVFIGADFDGIETPVKGLENVEKMDVLYEELLKLYPESTVKKIFYENLERFMMTSL